MRRTKKFLVISILFLTASIFADCASAQETIHSTTKSASISAHVSQASSAGLLDTQIIESYANSLEERFEYYYQQLSRIANGLEEKLKGESSEASEFISQARTELETAKKTGHEAVKTLRSVDQDELESLEFIQIAKEQSLETRSTFRSSIVLLKQAVASAEKDESK